MSEEPIENERELIEAIGQLASKIEQQNKILADFIEVQTGFRRRVLAGIWTGLGTVFGATVVVSFLIIALRPLTKLEWIKPVVGKVIDELQTRRPLATAPPEFSDPAEMTPQLTPQ